MRFAWCLSVLVIVTVIVSTADARQSLGGGRPPSVNRLRERVTKPKAIKTPVNFFNSKGDVAYVPSLNHTKGIIGLQKITSDVKNSTNNIYTPSSPPLPIGSSNVNQQAEASNSEAIGQHHSVDVRPVRLNHTVDNQQTSIEDTHQLKLIIKQGGCINHPGAQPQSHQQGGYSTPPGVQPNQQSTGYFNQPAVQPNEPSGYLKSFRQPGVQPNQQGGYINHPGAQSQPHQQGGYFIQSGIPPDQQGSYFNGPGDYYSNSYSSHVNQPSSQPNQPGDNYQSYSGKSMGQPKPPTSFSTNQNPYNLQPALSNNGQGYQSNPVSYTSNKVGSGGYVNPYQNYTTYGYTYSPGSYGYQSAYPGYSGTFINYGDHKKSHYSGIHIPIPIQMPIGGLEHSDGGHIQRFLEGYLKTIRTWMNDITSAQPQPHQQGFYFTPLSVQPHQQSTGYFNQLAVQPNQNLSCELNLPSLALRCDVADVVLLLKIINGLIQCPDLLAEIDFRVPTNTRSLDLLSRRYHLTNFDFNSPLARLVRLGNLVATECDPFFDGIPQIRSRLIHTSKVFTLPHLVFNLINKVLVTSIILLCNQIKTIVTSIKQVLSVNHAGKVFTLPHLVFYHINKVLVTSINLLCNQIKTIVTSIEQVLSLNHTSKDFTLPHLVLYHINKVLVTSINLLCNQIKTIVTSIEQVLSLNHTSKDFTLPHLVFIHINKVLVTSIIILCNQIKTIVTSIEQVLSLNHTSKDFTLPHLVFIHINKVLVTSIIILCNQIKTIVTSIEQVLSLNHTSKDFTLPHLVFNQINKVLVTRIIILCNQIKTIVTLIEQVLSLNHTSKVFTLPHLVFNQINKVLVTSINLLYNQIKTIVTSIKQVLSLNLTTKGITLSNQAFLILILITVTSTRLILNSINQAAIIRVIPEGSDEGHGYIHRLLDEVLKNRTVSTSNNETTPFFIQNNSTFPPCTTDLVIFDYLNVNVTFCTVLNCTWIKISTTTTASGEVKILSAGITKCFIPNFPYGIEDDPVYSIASQSHRKFTRVCKNSSYQHGKPNCEILNCSWIETCTPFADIQTKCSFTRIGDKTCLIFNT
ncbi:hypothetical protein J6590_059285 [Homalodisca vitripennis]|nr:hypothetical protein J6590_059285 [Homalodisca vitripennis]